MSRIHTHYDNLKVARNAPPEVIRAAYKTLSLKFHPDLNPGNVEAARIMAIINTSYDVLSDPVKRRAHDQWIMKMEETSEVNIRAGQANHKTIQRSSLWTILISFLVQFFNLIKGLVIWAFSSAIVLGAVIGFFWIIGSTFDFFGGESSPPLGPKPYEANPESVRPEYIRPITAPNGQPWPTSAAYVKGYKRLHTNGLSTVKVDNSRNDSDVFVKLVSLDGAMAYPVRQFYIPSFGNFTLNKVTAGSYDIRYRDLGNGGLSRSEAFYLEEI